MACSEMNGEESPHASSVPPPQKAACAPAATGGKSGEPRRFLEERACVLQRQSGADAAQQSTLLVLCTGGTICMKPNAKGFYAPVADLAAEFRRQPLFHDVERAAALGLPPDAATIVLPYARLRQSTSTLHLFECNVD